jgi:transcriptional regulator with XRE-family HTH domain
VTSSRVSPDFYMAEAFGVVLEGARTCRDLTLEQVALRAGVNAKYLERLERGIREPELSRLIDLAAAIGVSPVWLLEEAIAWRARQNRLLWPNGRDHGISEC